MTLIRIEKGKLKIWAGENKFVGGVLIVRGLRAYFIGLGIGFACKSFIVYGCVCLCFVGGYGGGLGLPFVSYELGKSSLGVCAESTHCWRYI